MISFLGNCELASLRAWEKAPTGRNSDATGSDITCLLKPVLTGYDSYLFSPLKWTSAISQGFKPLAGDVVKRRGKKGKE